MPKRGYRFIAEVSIVRKGEGEMLLTSRTGTRILIERLLTSLLDRALIPTPVLVVPGFFNN